MGIQDVPDNLSDTECIRCLECLETCAREQALTLKIAKP
jgi:polyferredoxin